jgi:hypothetical protein
MSKHRLSLEQIATVCGVVLAVATIPLAVIGQRAAAVARARAWIAPGPPCPVVSRLTDVGFEFQPLTAFDFEGAHFGMSYGEVNCSRIRDDPLLGTGSDPVCQFNNPTVVEVATPRGHFVFVTGIRAATIIIAHGRARCMLGAKLGFDWLKQ